MKKTDLTKEQVLHLAKLANLTISEDEASELKGQLDDTIAYIKNLDELDISKVAPTNHTTNSENVSFEDGTESTRTLALKDVFANAPTPPVDNKFRVPKILDKGSDE